MVGLIGLVVAAVTASAAFALWGNAQVARMNKVTLILAGVNGLMDMIDTGGKFVFCTACGDIHAYLLL